MTEPSSESDSLTSRILFFVVGGALALLLSAAGVATLGAVPLVVIGFVLLGEAYRYFTSEEADE